MSHTVFVVPFAMDATLRFVRAAAELEGAFVALCRMMAGRVASESSDIRLAAPECCLLTESEIALIKLLAALQSASGGRGTGCERFHSSTKPREFTADAMILVGCLTEAGQRVFHGPVESYRPELPKRTLRPPQNRLH